MLSHRANSIEITRINTFPPDPGRNLGVLGPSLIILEKIISESETFLRIAGLKRRFAGTPPRDLTDFSDMPD